MHYRTGPKSLKDAILSHSRIGTDPIAKRRRIRAKPRTIYA